MLCPKCNTPVEDDTVFCGICGNQVAPLYARGATIAEPTEKLPEGNRPQNALGGDRFAPFQPTQRAYTPVGLNQPGMTPLTPLPSRVPRSNVRLVVFFAVLLVVIIAASTAMAALLKRNGGNTGAGVNPTGAVSFSDGQNGQGHTNTVKIHVSGLNAPPNGSQYDAWLVDEQTEHVLPLGMLVPQSQGFSLNFTSKNTNLLAAGNKVNVTQEQGNVNLPTGNVVLSATLPTLALVHIRHLLVSFPSAPGGTALLVGLLNQTQLVNGQALILKNAATNGNTTSIGCAAQSMLDVIEGTDGAHYGPLPQTCSLLNITTKGDGFGLLGQGGNGYLDTAAAHASLAATSADATDTIKVHAKHVEISTENIKGWLTTVDQDLQALLANPNDTSKVQEIVTLSGHALNGVNLDDDESIDPVPGEAGAITAYDHGQLMATLTLAH